MNYSVRLLVAMSAVVFVGCSSSTHGGPAGAGGHAAGSQGNGGATANSGGIGGSAGVVGSGGKSDHGGSTGGGGIPGGTWSQGGASAVSDAGAFQDAAVDVPACQVCPPMRCAYGSPVDGNGCIVCACNPAPDGSVDVSTTCALPESCTDADSDIGAHADTGGRSEVSRVDAVEGIKCGTAVCAWGKFCCNALTSTCVTSGEACAL